MKPLPRILRLLTEPSAGSVFLLALAVRILILSRFSASPYFLPASDDMRFYADWAQRIGHGQWSDHFAFYGLPGYAFLMAGVFFLTGFDPFIMGLLQCGAEAGTAVLIYRLALETLSNPAPSLAASAPALPQSSSRLIGGLAALGWIFYQPAQTFSVILMPTAWLVLAFWGCLWQIVRLRQASGWWPWLGLGVFIGVIAMMVATILFLIPIFLAAMFLTIARERPWSQRAPRLALASAVLGLGTFAGASPAWIHNYFHAHDPVLLSAHSGLNFYMGSNANATGYPKIPEGLRANQAGLLRDSITRAEEAAGRPLKRSEVSKFWSEKADAWVQGHRREWLALLGVKLRNFWNAFQYDDLSEINLLRDEGILPPGLRFGLVAALGLPGMWWAGRLFPKTRWVAAALLLHMCALLPVFITERYRLCAVPGLLLFAAFTIWKLWDYLARARWSGASALLGALALSTWFVTLPQRDPGLWALDPFNTALKVQRAGHLELAQRKLETAYALVPDNAELNFALGNLWFEKNDLDRARPFYERTLALLPDHTGALNNFGRLETLRQHWEAGEALLRASLALDPKSIKTHLFLAELKLASGDRAGAQAALAPALALRPDQPELLEFRDKLAKP